MHIVEDSRCTGNRLLLLAKAALTYEWQVWLSVEGAPCIFIYTFCQLAAMRTLLLLHLLAMHRVKIRRIPATDFLGKFGGEWMGKVLKARRLPDKQTNSTVGGC